MEKTDATGQRIVGLNTENAEINEGLVRFDIIFYVRMPSASGMKNGLSQIIVQMVHSIGQFCGAKRSRCVAERSDVVRF